MREIFHRIPFLFLVFFAGCCSARAQAMCPIETLSVNRIQGRVMAGTGQHASVLPGTKLELKRLGEPEILIASIETDDKGFFQIGNIQKGKYRLRIHFILNGTSHAAPYDVILKVKKTNASKSTKQIYIELDVNCFGNIVKVVNKLP